MDNIQHWKMQEIWSPFHKQNYSIPKVFSSFERTSSKIQMLIRFASQNCLFRETAVKRISFLVDFSMLYVVS